MGQQIIFMPERHSHADGNLVFERHSGYPIKSGMTIYDFRRTPVNKSVRITFTVASELLFGASHY